MCIIERNHTEVKVQTSNLEKKLVSVISKRHIFLHTLLFEEEMRLQKKLVKICLSTTLMRQPIYKYYVDTHSMQLPAHKPCIANEVVPNTILAILLG